MSDETRQALDTATGRLEEAHRQELATRRVLLSTLGAASEALTLQRVRHFIGMNSERAERLGRPRIQELRQTVARLWSNHNGRLNSETFEQATWPVAGHARSTPPTPYESDVLACLVRVQRELAQQVAQALIDYGFEVSRNSSINSGGEYVPDTAQSPALDAAVGDEVKALQAVSRAATAQKNTAEAHRRDEATALWDD